MNQLGLAIRTAWQNRPQIMRSGWFFFYVLLGFVIVTYTIVCFLLTGGVLAMGVFQSAGGTVTKPLVTGVLFTIGLIALSFFIAPLLRLFGIRAARQKTLGIVMFFLIAGAVYHMASLVTELPNFWSNQGFWSKSIWAGLLIVVVNALGAYLLDRTPVRGLAIAGWCMVIIGILGLVFIQSGARPSEWVKKASSSSTSFTQPSRQPAPSASSSSAFTGCSGSLVMKKDITLTRDMPVSETISFPPTPWNAPYERCVKTRTEEGTVKYYRNGFFIGAETPDYRLPIPQNNPLSSYHFVIGNGVERARVILEVWERQI